MAKTTSAASSSNRLPAFTPAIPDLDPLIQASNKLFEAWTTIGTELLEFSRNRLDQNLEASRQLAQSTSFNEAMELQAKFNRAMVEDYLNEVNKIADLSTRSLIDSMTTLQQQQSKAAARLAEAAE